MFSDRYAMIGATANNQKASEMDSTVSLDIATLIVAFATGVAVAVFAGLTYKLSRSITQRRYSPVLEVYSIGSPETGSFDQKQVRFYGARWGLSLVNSGDVPIWADNINILAKVTRLESEQDVWASIGKFCELYDEEGNALADRAIGVNGNSHRKITVFWCHEDLAPEQHRLFKAGDATKMQLELVQKGKHGRPQGWLIERSNSFRVPDKFGKELIRGSF